MIGNAKVRAILSPAPPRHLRRCHPRTSQRGMCSTLWLCCSCVPFAHVPWPSQDVDCCFRRAATGSWGGGDGDWKVANSKVAFRHNFGSSCTRSVHCCAGYRVWCCVWVMYVVRIVFNGYSMYSTLKFKVQGLPSEHENPSFLAKIAFWLPKNFSLRGPTMVGRAAAGPLAQTSATIHSLQVESFTPTITVTFASGEVRRVWV